MSSNGAIAACDNAERPSGDDDLFLGNGSLQSNFAMPLIAWEEANKAGMLLKSYVEKTDISKTQWESKYLSHIIKLQAYPSLSDMVGVLNAAAVDVRTAWFHLF